ncbi:MAG TPA: hypothetical protein VGA94_02720, partial [Thermodesulfobacteriota bacterium]
VKELYTAAINITIKYKQSQGCGRTNLIFLKRYFVPRLALILDKQISQIDSNKEESRETSI